MVGAGTLFPDNSESQARIRGNIALGLSISLICCIIIHSFTQTFYLYITVCV